MIKPLIDENRNVLQLNYPNAKTIEIPLDLKLNNARSVSMCETKICGERINGYDCGDEIANWLSNVLMIDGLRLLRQNDQHERKNGKLALANQAQYLLISEPSVEWLMNQVECWDYDNNVDNIVDRFRGNFVISNVEPLIENEWKTIKINPALFHVQGPCTRCQMICIDQSNGEKTTEPLRTIGKIFKGKTRFGIYLKCEINDDVIIKCGEKLMVNF
jgi:molybdenum cofactor sulfurtransferase